MPNTQTAKPRRAEKAPNQEPTAPAAGASAVFANILCAVDGTRTSNAAVRIAAGLTGPGGHLTLLAVTAQAGSGQYAAAAISPDRAKSILSYAKSIAKAAGAESSTVVDPGRPPVKVILERAADHDLLVIGAPATSRLGGLVIGGVTADALSKFATPMLVARRSFTGSLLGRPILVASDGQEGSDHLVELAGRLGLSLQAPVTLLHALGAESAVRPARIESQSRALALALPDRSDVRVEPGRARDVILEAAESTKAAIVVLGSRRLGGLRALGSVSRRVVHDAPCSVLLLPPRK